MFPHSKPRYKQNELRQWQPEQTKSLFFFLNVLVMATAHIMACIKSPSWTKTYLLAASHVLIRQVLQVA
jgi:hypothetical protein